MPTIQNRRATAAQWTAFNPVLAAGEIGFELDTNALKVGDGLTPWETLPYLSDESLKTLVESGRLSEAVLNDTYADVATVAALPTKDMVRTPAAQHQPIAPTVSKQLRPADMVTAQTGTTYGRSLVDKSTLNITFTAPPSGKVMVELTAAAATGAGAGLSWCLLGENGFDYFPSTDQVAIPGKPDFQAQRLSTTRHLVTALPGGAPLVPGKRYTLYWGHANTANSGTPAYTSWGGTPAVAEMKVTPISNRLDERPVVATLTPTDGTAILEMSADGKRLYGTHTNQRLAWSEDEGVTWVTPNPKWFEGGIPFVRELDNGEVLVFTGTRPPAMIGPQIWRSSGFATNPATATFTAVCEHDGAAPDATGFGGGPSWWPGGIDHHGPYVVATEYGPKEGVGQIARYIWFSDDYGQTFRKCFDLVEQLAAEGVTGDLYGAHLHGVCYDPWWDAIWACNGDGEFAHSWVSFDHGETWINLHQDQQFTSIIAMSDGIVWVTDEGNPNGVYRIPRTSAHRIKSGGDPLWEITYARDWNPGLSIVGTRPYHRRSVPDAPLLLPSGTGVANGQASLMVSYDGGRTITDKVWEGTYPGGSVSTSLAQIVGPTAAGKYHGAYRDPDGTFRLTLEVQ